MLYSGGTISEIYDENIENFEPSDGTGTYLQPLLRAGFYPVNDRTYAGFGSGETTVSDTDGHKRLWYYDDVSGGRVNQENIYDPNLSPVWLITTATWDSQNDLTSIITPRGNYPYPSENSDPSAYETNFAYNDAGDLIGVASPPVTTSIGAIRPTATYSYDQFHNLDAYCDPVYNEYNSWYNPANSPPTCSAGSGVTSYGYDYSDTDEPFGKLTNIQSAGGYATRIAYDTASSGGDFGLPLSITGATFTQNNNNNSSDLTSITPQVLLSYDGNGNVLTYSAGDGPYSLTYDSTNLATAMNRLVSVTDPDSVTTYTYYNSDGSLACTQSAYQHALDGAACGAHSRDYTYDQDGDPTSVTTHFGQTATNNVAPGTTSNWYDGIDRLVEVQIPSDALSDNSVPWRTRYIYDLSLGGSVQFTGSGAPGPFSAFGGLYKTQNYFTAPGGSLGWNDVTGNAYDALDRPLTRLQYSPGNGIQTWTRAYDANGYYGLPTSTVDPMDVTTSYGYDSLGRLSSLSFSDTTPNRTYLYDPDGRTAQIGAQRYTSPDSYTYDADGDVIAYTEATASGLTSPATISYAYYAPGLRKSLSVSSAALSANPEFTYNYRTDGLRTSLLVAGQTKPFAWSYNNAGQMTSQSDPYTGQTVTPPAYASNRPPGSFAQHTELARTSTYAIRTAQHAGAT